MQYFVICSLIRTFDFVESTLARKSPNIIWLFAHLFVPLTYRSKVGCISEIQRKTCFPLVFLSICTTFDFVESTLARKSPNIIWLFAHLFVPLTYRSKVGCISEIQRKTCFPLVFLSICTTFAHKIIILW